MHTDSTGIQAPTKELVDAALTAYSERRIHDAERIGPQYVRLRKSIDALIRVGGKRLRPLMVLSMYHAYEPTKPVEHVIPAAISQELIHLAMLVHDDIIDRDLIRYGIPNVAGYYQAYYNAHVPRTEERNHLALSAALLAGDSLMADAHQEIRRTELSPLLVQQAEDILSQSIFDVIGGELLDTEVGILPKGSITPLAVAEHKTSSYSFVGPLTTGAVLAEAPEKDVALLAELGKYLGIGYQLKDDLLGMFGDEAKTGKSTTTDIREGKRTFMIEEFERLASESEQAEFFAIFHRDSATDEEIALARLLLMRTGAEKAVNERIDSYQRQCEEIVEQLTLTPEAKAWLHDFVATCLVREK